MIILQSPANGNPPQVVSHGSQVFLISSSCGLLLCIPLDQFTLRIVPPATAEIHPGGIETGLGGSGIDSIPVLIL